MATTLWNERASALEIDGRAFIGGQRTWAKSDQRFDNLSAVDGRKLAEVARCDGADVDAAVAAARRAFEQGSWAGRSPAARKRVLIAFAALIVKHADELALLETLDMGKPIRDSLRVDVPSAANCIRWYGEAIDKIYDEIAPTPANSLALITREPVGVVAAIVPWNYPMIMAAWKIAPALAAGNSVVLKPSEKSPLSALRLAEIAIEAGLPEGVFNVVTGFGHEAGAALALHMDVDCVAFTGSTRVGKQIMQMAAQSNLKRAWTELGGKSANIVCADCPDLDAAVNAAVGSIFYNQGESCNAPSRLFVEASIKDRFLEQALAMMSRFQPGDPLDEATVMGAIVDPALEKLALHAGSRFGERPGNGHPDEGASGDRLLREPDDRSLRRGGVGRDRGRRRSGRWPGCPGRGQDLTVRCGRRPKGGAGHDDPDDEHRRQRDDGGQSLGDAGGRAPIRRARPGADRSRGTRTWGPGRVRDGGRPGVRDRGPSRTRHDLADRRDGRSARGLLRRRDRRPIGGRWTETGLGAVIPRAITAAPSNRLAHQPHADRLVDDPGQPDAPGRVARQEADEDREEAEDGQRPDEQFHDGPCTPSLPPSERGAARAILAPRRGPRTCHRRGSLAPQRRRQSRRSCSSVSNPPRARMNSTKPLATNTPVNA